VQVRFTTFHITRDGLDGLPRYLRVTRVIEVDYTAASMGPAECRELLADCLYVERTLHDSSHPETNFLASLHQAEM